MAAIRLLAWCDLRRRVVSTAVLALLVGFVGVVVLASIAGARRTASSLARFEESTAAADVEVNAGETTAEQLRAFERTPNVEAVGALRQLSIFREDAGFLPAAGPLDDAFGSRVDRARLVAGREAHAVDELTIGEGLTSKLGVQIGDRLTFQSYSREQITEAVEEQSAPRTPEGPTVTFRVVGIVRRPLDLGGRGAAGGVIVPTRAFVDQYRDEIGSFSGTVLRVRTKHGAADVPGVIASARRIFGGSDQFQTLGLAIEGAGAQSAIDVTTAGLWILAGVAALAGLVAIGLALARHMAPLISDEDILRALGCRRRQVWHAPVATTLPIAIGGSLIAVVGAALASSIFPIGVARDAEPARGFDIDGLVLGLGFLALTVLVLAVAALAAFVSTVRSDAMLSRPALPTAAASRAGLPPSMATGIGFALERGRGRGAVPVRSSILGASFGVLAVVAALLFAASLDRLTSTPRLYGWTWDFVAVDASAPDDDACGPTQSFDHDPMVSSVMLLCFTDTEIAGRPVLGYSFQALRGTGGPAVIEGRAPRSAREIALGAATLQAAGKELGDSVRVTTSGGSTRYRIVGRSVFTLIPGTDPQPLADGVAFTRGGLERPGAEPTDGYALVRLVPGVDRSRALTHLRKVGDGFEPGSPETPTEIDRLRQIDALPGLLAAVVAVVAVVAVGYALVTAVRRRRRDLAVLKTLGYKRAQVRATVAWHATTVAVIGLVVGIPLGLIVGRVVWSWVADDLGVSTAATIPVAVLLALGVGVLILANLVAAIPAHAAARTRPALVLRSE